MDVILSLGIDWLYKKAEDVFIVSLNSDTYMS